MAVLKFLSKIIERKKLNTLFLLIIPAILFITLEGTNVNIVIIIVEVKTRSSDKFGSPLDAITREKISYLVRAAKAYLNSYRLSHEVQFDVITIIGNDINNIKIEHIEDAFRAPLRTYR